MLLRNGKFEYLMTFLLVWNLNASEEDKRDLSERRCRKHASQTSQECSSALEVSILTNALLGNYFFVNRWYMFVGC